MPMVNSKNALPTMGALYITISFKVFEIKNRSYVKDGNSAFVFNVRNNRKQMLKNAIYNCVKREFPNRTVTPYDIIVMEYYYQYYLNDYEIIRKNNKYYETYIDVETHKRKKYLKDRITITDKYIGELGVDKNDNH